MIGYATEYGGPSSYAFKLFSPLQAEFNEALSNAEQWKHQDEWVIALRVSGEFTDFGVTDCDRVSYSKKRGRLTGDIGIQQGEWNAQPKEVVRDLLLIRSLNALESMLDYCQRNKIPTPSKAAVEEIRHILTSLKTRP